MPDDSITEELREKILETLKELNISLEKFSTEAKKSVDAFSDFGKSAREAKYGQKDKHEKMR